MSGKLPRRMTAAQLKRGGFSNSLWRLDELDAARRANQERRTISELLAEFGITHKRDANSLNTGAHRLYLDGQFIGEYTAAQASDLIDELQGRDLTAKR